MTSEGVVRVNFRIYAGSTTSDKSVFVLSFQAGLRPQGTAGSRFAPR